MVRYLTGQATPEGQACGDLSYAAIQTSNAGRHGAWVPVVSRTLVARVPQHNPLYHRWSVALHGL